MQYGKTKPRLELLEDRTVPAVLLQLDGAGNLRGIFGNTNEDVALTWTADNTVNVMEGAIDLGTYSVVGSLSVTLGNTNAAGVEVLVDLGGFSLDGSLSITLGNATFGYGVDVGNGTIGGSLSVRTGNGPDEVYVGGFEEAGLAVAGSVFIDLGGGNDEALVATTDIGGRLQVLNVNDAFEMIDSTVGSLFSFDSRRESLPVRLSVNSESSIAGTTTIATGAGNDTITLDGSFLAALTVQMGNGANTIGISSTAQVLGAATIVGGNGVDSVNVLGAYLASNLTINLANGNDAVDLTGSTILGNSITVIGGNGADSLTIGAGGLTAPGARLTFLGGNGNDTFTFNATASVLASLYYDGGFGVDAFNVTGVIAFPSTVRNVP